MNKSTESWQPSGVPTEHIDLSILELRGEKVPPNAKLIALYNVKTKRLAAQVRRNDKRFSADLCSD